MKHYAAQHTAVSSTMGQFSRLANVLTAQSAQLVSDKTHIIHTAMKNTLEGLTNRLLVAAVVLSSSLMPMPEAHAASGICSVQTDSSGTLRSARSLYFSQCEEYALRDCDPVGGGGWMCSSQVIGRFSPDFRIAERVESEPVASPALPEPGDSQRCYVVGATLDEAKQSFAQNCNTHARKDCDPRAQNQWVCSSENITSSTQFAEFNNSDIPAIETPPAVLDAPVTPTAPIEQTPPTPVQPEPTPDPAPTPQPPASGSGAGRLATPDLLALHYDNCPDRDDGHALPAGKAVVDALGISNVMVVNGTCGDAIRNRFNPASHAVATAVWGDSYLDADGARASAVFEAANRWASTLSNGGDVWVAEGGQSDFTADVVKRIESQFPGNNLKNIHVIQHSAGRTAYNEVFTQPDNLGYLQDRTHYQTIPNGNVGGNGSADLNEQSNTFVSMARSSRYSAEWEAAFDYLRPDCAVRTENCKLDFSDTVELLYIVDDQRTLTVEDFANTYLR